MARVTSGLERFIDQGPTIAGLSPGARCGVLAHAASIDSRARHAVELLCGLSSIRVVRLFAPEHGIHGHEQDMERVNSSGDASGLPVISLYGGSADSLRPRGRDLDGLDAVIFDLQDVGSRYYTYVYTLSFLMEAARDAGVAVVVLDRPNPLGGVHVEGPLLDPSLSSFVGRYPLPVRHGMTVAELARMFNESFAIGCDLRIVEIAGWERSMSFEATGLPWVPPSPNMPTLQTARVYPGGCLVEGTNLSEGRGTTTPFELVGAPWLDGRALAGALRDLNLEGVLFRPASFRPMFQKHVGRGCGGVQVIVEDAERFRPFVTYLALLRAARAQSPTSFAWRTEAYEFETERLAIDLLLGRADLRPMLESEVPLAEIERSWAEDLAAFAPARRDCLLYD